MPGVLPLYFVIGNVCLQLKIPTVCSETDSPPTRYQAPFPEATVVTKLCNIQLGARRKVSIPPVSLQSERWWKT